MKKIPILILLCLLGNLAQSQNTYLNTYHAQPDFYLHSDGGLLKCKNGDQIITNTYEDTIGSQNRDILIATRIDSSGNIVWNAALEEQYYYPGKIFEDLEGNIYVFGTNKLKSNLVKISATGQVVWSKHYGTMSTFYNAVMLDTGDFVAIGGVLNKNGWKNDIYMVKLNQDGEILWEKSTNFEDGGYAETIINTEDGGMIIGGTRDGDVKFPGGSLFFAKMDKNGQLLWLKSLGYFNSSTRKILKTGPSNYTIVSSGFYSSSGANFNTL